MSGHESGFEARLVPDPRDPIPHLTVWVRIDLGDKRREWLAVARVKGVKQ